MAQDVTDAELAVLQVLWGEPAATIRELTQRLYPGGSASEYATVQKLLERLERKGWVSRDASAVPHRFQAARGRDALLARRLDDIADTLCEGSVAPLLSHLVRSERLADAEVDELRALIARLDRRGGS